MPYPGAALAITVGVGVAAAVYHYFFKEENPQQHRQNTYGSSWQNTYSDPWQNTYDSVRQNTDSRPSVSTSHPRRKKESCMICQKEMTKQVKALSCGHVFHNGCAIKWLNTHKSCPICRTYQSIEKIQQHSHNISITPSSSVSSPKKNESCLICLKEMTKRVRKLSCGHVFHNGCAIKWINTHKSCPVCRTYQSIETKEQHRQNAYYGSSCPALTPRKKESCSICLEEMTQRVRTLSCGHVFHNVCVTKWLNSNKSCPHCRKYQFA